MSAGSQGDRDSASVSSDPPADVFVLERGGPHGDTAQSVVEQRPTPGTRHRRLSARECLDVLCDSGSVQMLRTGARSLRLGDTARAGDGVLVASATVHGRPIFCYAQDGQFVGGSVGEAHAESIVRCLQLAHDARVPVIGFVESAGARLQEGVVALDGYARIFRANVRLAGVAPQISLVTGTCAGGGCYSPALTDFVVIVKEASMFLTGPKVVASVTGEAVTAAELGGPRVHSSNGVCHLVADDARGAALIARELLSYLPQNSLERPPRRAPEPACGDDPGDCVPADTRRAYDVRKVIARLVDGGTFLEIAPKWARNLVTGFARIDGWSVGVVANQPHYRGGVLDVAAAQKGARFVRTCDAYNIPLVVLVDTPGFMPGTRQESGGVIRFGARLLEAFAGATVPKLTVVVRQAYGGGYIAMCSKGLGADLAFAWPSARIGIMGASQAVGIIHRRGIEGANGDGRELGERLAAEYASQHLGADVSACEGAIDEVVMPAETRARLCGALAALAGKGGASAVSALAGRVH